MKKTLVLGIGNTIRGDDGVGIFAVRLLSKQIDQFNIDVKETQEAGIKILDMVEGYEKVVMIDSICTRGGKPGNIYRLTKEILETNIVPYSFHQMGLSIIKMGIYLDMNIPKKIVIYAVEIKKADYFDDCLTSNIRGVIPKAVDLIKKELS